ncbi:MAG: DivIVA domain-containing protein [Hamadaea sp.]|uniref:DivIVA domain-containing protein n=1 Tax=Hamadaea sp. TaxID=2024425 RepID=UPI001815FBC7|nr:DivIVA domain-containing protein [Hamadaea sp.]NUR73352.1 DivIVA domain-containing protein [Hamadaea sp.]NUT21280.1 DivIVA domain-containing protein [Hamadaea sp.]
MGQLLTPDDIRQVAFSKPGLGRRGYDEEGVDAFLDAIEQTVSALYEEIARLRASSTSAVAGPSPSTSDGAVLGELSQIRAALARIEAAVGRTSQPGGSPLF